MKKNSYLLFLVFIAVFLLSYGTALALEVPSFGIKAGSSLPEYVKYLFTLIIGLAGTIAAISFVIGAIQLIISLDNPTASSSAKDRMKGAILGLVLTASSFIIINTINPKLTVLKLEALPPTPPIQTITPPGVYLFAEAGCGGKGLGPITYSSSIDSVFAGKVKSFKIVNSKDSFYGIIFHEARSEDKFGRCSNPYTRIVEGIGACMPVNPAYSYSADVYLVSPIGTGEEGSGVTFYSEPHGWDTGQQAGFYPIKTAQISGVSAEGVGADPSTIKFLWDNVGRPDAYKTTHQTFQKSHGSIKLNGTYLVGLYSNSSGGLYCKTFTDDAPNLNAEQILAPGANGTDFNMVWIIPTK